MGPPPKAPLSATLSRRRNIHGKFDSRGHFRPVAFHVQRGYCRGRRQSRSHLHVLADDSAGRRDRKLQRGHHPASAWPDPPGSYHWVFGDGSTETTSSRTFAHAYQRAGTFNVTLTVTDDLGLTATSSPTSVTVLTDAPNADFDFVVTNRTVAFNPNKSSAIPGRTIAVLLELWRHHHQHGGDADEDLRRPRRLQRQFDDHR